MDGNKDLWFGQDGVTLSQHTTNDDRFPGWQKSFGEGTFQADYTSGGRFPNDDASHIQVDDGFRATVMQNSYEAGNQGSGDKEEVFTGPIDANLTDYDMNDMVSEIKVEDLRPPDADNNQDGTDGTDGSDVSDDDIEDMETGGMTLEEYQAGLGGGSGNNTLLYVIGGIAVLAIGYMIMKKNK